MWSNLSCIFIFLLDTPVTSRFILNMVVINMNYKISELAKLAGISTRTLRHYDDIGLLKPVRQKDSNYRVYGEQQVNMLQHILILKEMGIELNQIKVMMKDINDLKRLNMLENHLITLKQKKERMDAIIDNVRTTIKNMKGEIQMKDQDKFEGLKEKMLKENDDKYQDEAIERWGKDRYEQSKNAFKNFTKEDFDQLNQLATDLIDVLKQIKKDPTNQD
jgi:MerR family transcriptional regulator, thiopeptide resistance regulator